MNQEKKSVGAKKLYKEDEQPKQMNVRYVTDADKAKIKTIERKLLNGHKIKL